jgi:nucleoside-diphosphate-sugar epimerase
MGGKNILLTGATDFLGYRILEGLVQSDSVKSITAAGRLLTPFLTVKHPKVHYQLGNLEEEEYAFNLVRNSDIIINAASLSSPWGKETDFMNANVLTQRNLIKASIELKIERFIYISTLSVCFNSRDRFLVKEMPKNKIPYSVAIAVAYLMELKSKFTNYKEPPLTRYGIKTLAKAFTIDISKAKKLLGYDPKVTIKMAIEEFVKWYLNEERSKIIPE